MRNDELFHDDLRMIRLNVLEKFARAGEEKIKVGIVGEIYVKYSPLGNNNLEEFLLSDDLLERTLAEFRRTQPFIAILNRAVQFAYEEMM